MAAIQAGTAACTHTFNAMAPLHQHRPAIIGAALESDVYCEMICDGLHLHPAIVRLLWKTKGPQRLVAITDSIMAAGLPDGNYHLGVNQVVVEKGDAKLASDGTRAGSTLTQDRCFRLDPQEVELEEGDTLCFAAQVTDQYGRSFMVVSYPGFVPDLLCLQEIYTFPLSDFAVVGLY